MKKKKFQVFGAHEERRMNNLKYIFSNTKPPSKADVLF